MKVHRRVYCLALANALSLTHVHTKTAHQLVEPLSQRFAAIKCGYEVATKFANFNIFNGVR